MKLKYTTTRHKVISMYDMTLRQKGTLVYVPSYFGNKKAPDYVGQVISIISHPYNNSRTYEATRHNNPTCPKPEPFYFYRSPYDLNSYEDRMMGKTLVMVEVPKTSPRKKITKTIKKNSKRRN
jgi:hypothetical protein